MEFYSIWPYFTCLVLLLALASAPFFAIADTPPNPCGIRLAGAVHTPDLSHFASCRPRGLALCAKLRHRSCCATTGAHYQKSSSKID